MHATHAKRRHRDKDLRLLSNLLRSPKPSYQHHDTVQGEVDAGARARGSDRIVDDPICGCLGRYGDLIFESGVRS